MVMSTNGPGLFTYNPDGSRQRNPDISDADYAKGIEELKNLQIEALWQAATDHEQAYIYGSAIGVLAVGVLQGKPKSLAVKGWIDSIWALYYQRKPQVTEVWNTALNDFSSCGPMPYSCPELMTEIGF